MPRTGSLARYNRWRDAYAATGSDQAMARMLRAVTPAVAAELSQVEHYQATQRRLAAEKAAAAIREAAEARAAARAHTWQEIRTIAAMLGLTVLICVLAGALLTALSQPFRDRQPAYGGMPQQYAEQYAQRLEQVEQVEQLEQAQPLPLAGTGPGWLTLAQDGRAVLTVHVRNLLGPDPDTTLLEVTPWTGPAYLLDLGTMRYAFTKDRP